MSWRLILRQPWWTIKTAGGAVHQPHLFFRYSLWFCVAAGLLGKLEWVFLVEHIDDVSNEPIHERLVTVVAPPRITKQKLKRTRSSGTLGARFRFISKIPDTVEVVHLCGSLPSWASSRLLRELGMSLLIAQGKPVTWLLRYSSGSSESPPINQQ